MKKIKSRCFVCHWSLIQFLIFPSTAWAEAPNIVRPGAQFRLISKSDVALNSVIEVDWDGDAQVSLCGKIKLKGLTKESALESIHQCLLRFFKKKPELFMEEILPRHFVIKIGMRGEPARVVKTPANTSVKTLIAREGFLVTADSTIRLLSPQGFDLVAPAGSREWMESFFWQGGESVILEKQELQKISETFDVLGEVRKPGKYTYRPARTVIDVLREVQGPTPQASYDSVVIFRQTSGRKIETRWDDATTKIEPGDVLLIPAQKETSFDKSLRWTGSLLTIVNTLFLILLARR